MYTDIHIEKIYFLFEHLWKAGEHQQLKYCYDNNKNKIISLNVNNKCLYLLIFFLLKI